MSSRVNNLQDMHAHLSPLHGSCWTQGGYLCSCHESLRMIRVKICHSNRLFLSSHTSHNNSNREATMQHCFLGVFLFLSWLEKGRLTKRNMSQVPRLMTGSFWECRCKQLGHRHQKQQHSKFQVMWCWTGNSCLHSVVCLLAGKTYKISAMPNQGSGSHDW